VEAGDENKLADEFWNLNETGPVTSVYKYERIEPYRVRSARAT
jgi:hypothetical protein